MLFKKIFLPLIFCLTVFPAASQTLAMENQAIAFDEWETEHFILNFEKTDDEDALSPPEAGRMLEALWQVLDEKMGYNTSAEANNEDRDTKPGTADNFVKCRVYVLNHEKSHTQILKEHKVDGSMHHLAFFHQLSASIYYRKLTHSHTIRTLLHEATHFYCYATYPHVWEHFKLENGIRFAWFTEGIALHFGQYWWDGLNLIDMAQLDYYRMPLYDPDCVEKFLISSLIHDHNTTLSSEYIDKCLSPPFLNDVRVVTENNLAANTQSICQLFGDYLLLVRPDIVRNFFQNASELFTRNEKNLNAKDIFSITLNKAVENNQVFILDILVWYRSQPLICFLDPRYWEENQYGFVVEADRGWKNMRLKFHAEISPIIHVQLLSEEEPKTASAITINLSSDLQNQDEIRIRRNGSVLRRSLKNNQWGKVEKTAQLETQTNVNLQNEYYWYGKRNGSNIDIYINDQKVATHDNAQNDEIAITFTSGKFSVRFNKHNPPACPSQY